MSMPETVAATFEVAMGHFLTRQIIDMQWRLH